MGGFILYLADSGSMTSGPGFQVGIGQWLAGVFAQIEVWTAGVPEPVLGAALLAVAGVFVAATLRPRRRTPAVPDTTAALTAPCQHCDTPPSSAEPAPAATPADDTEGARP
jgi:hypothetical protein